MVAVISMETLTEETEEELAAEQSLPSLQSPVVADDASAYEARLTAALEEWQAVGAKEIKIDQCRPLPPLPIVHCSRILTYEEAADIIIGSVNMRDYRHRITPTVQRKGLKKLWHKLFGHRKIDVELIEERDLMFALALVSFDTECKSHDQMVQTIYRKLTGSSYDCPRYGGHWETIGFQGNDPATDLRGCGILGLLQLLYLATHQDNEAVARDLYQVSLHATQNFPFAIMGINMTKIALESLREECLNKICSQRRCVLPVLNDFYVGTYLIMFLSWTKHAATIHDTGYIMQEVKKFVKSSPAEVISNLQYYRNNGVHSHFCDQHFTGLAM
ncbi:ELMO domain-containing protein 3-like [Tropilaelaps mercedesae]|uniref:ELMO domain-containing protein 3-like n=1 Tax=Tropilaelaps mercedesae TaxID=418985 RepID=A0A1V9X1G6_9ACAR|nr:ELMO domain-containing protein 3-like [Tropilaelaps mercedesae]